MMRLAAIATTILLAHVPARADDEGPPPTPETLSLTISPAHLTLPVVEAMAEVRADPSIGLALIAGFGQAYEADVIEAGAQANWYPGSTFRGFHIGVEFLYIHGTYQATKLSTQGLAGGPYIGHKWILSSGYTIDLQLGIDVVIARERETSSDRSVFPLANANFGWSL